MAFESVKQLIEWDDLSLSDKLCIGMAVMDGYTEFYTVFGKLVGKTPGAIALSRIARGAHSLSV